MSDTKYRALVAHPDPYARRQIAEALVAARFAVTEVHDDRELAEIVTLMPQDHFRLVVVDRAMPGVHVIDALGGGPARAPVVIVTGPPCEELFEAATMLGGSAHVMPPSGLGTLMETVDDLVFGKTAPARPKFDGSRG